ncbi:MAG TPA: alpha-amylase family protein [Capsulimonadaceae bacterium]|jgi:hypothetical protein
MIRTSLCVALSLAATAVALAEPSPPPANVVVNGGFETPLRFNGTPLRRFPAGDAAYLGSERAGKRQVWIPIDAQGWLAEGADAGGVTVTGARAHTGRRCLEVTAGDAPRSVISTFEPQVDAGPVTLTAWVRSKGAKGTLSLDIVNDWHQVQGKAATVRKQVDVAGDSDWTLVTLQADSTKKLIALTRLAVSQGTVWLDDVQIAQSPTPLPFNYRPQEWLRLSVAGGVDSEMSQWRQGAGGKALVIVTNESLLPLTGKVSVWVGPWDKPKQRLAGSFDGVSLKSGSSRSFDLPVGTLPTGAYVASVTIDGGTLAVDGERDFFPLQFAGGAVSNGAVSSRSVLRFVVSPNVAPQDIFGVSNGMLAFGKGNWYAGYDPQDYVDGGELGVVCGRGHYSDDVGYAVAMGRMNYHATMFDDFPGGPFGDIDQAPLGAPAAALNPASPGFLDVSSAAGMALLTARATEAGKWLAKRPQIASYQMSNEAPFINRGHLCPSPAADGDFREWCRARYGTIEAANGRWRTSYKSWGEVEQIVSARFLDEVKAQPKLTGAAAIDWTASAGRLSDAVVKRMNENPGVAMDWMRWRTATTLRAYRAFHDAAKKQAPNLLISTNLCWPDFFPEMAMPFYRSMDVTMIDVQYTAGMPRGLGSPYEMMDAMEMSETCAPGKAVWGIETYYQPQWPAEYLALQNWGLLAHGMTNNLVFGWKPYSDAGPVKGNKAWEDPKAVPMWFLIDNDGTKLPGYATFKRSLDEVRAYHDRHDGLAIKRVSTDTALYVSMDTAQYVEMQTGNKPWGSPWQRTRNNLIFLLRMNGATVEYVDDDTLPDSPGKYRKVVVPASYILSQPAAEKLARFAKAGGTVILAGPSGVCDPWLATYPNIGGAAWADLKLTASKFSDAYAAVSFQAAASKADSGPSASEKPGTMGGKIDETIPVGKEFRGSGYDAISGEPIKDAAGSVIGFQRAWGKGNLIAYGVFPDTYSTDPHGSPNLHAWAKQLITLGGLPVAGQWTGDGAVVTGTPGNGSAVVEVVVRQKSDRERFVYCLNQGGPGSGTVEVALPGDGWKATDVLTGRAVAGTLSGGKWRAPMTLGQFGYAVVRLGR